MLYWLSQFSEHLSFLNLLRYITLRSMGALFTAFLVVFFAGPPFIAWMRRLKKEGQPIRIDGPASHLLTKKGTPTMGGVLILSALVVSTLLWANLCNPYVWLLTGLLLAYGALGGIDDYIKLSQHTHHGLSPQKKLFFQAAIGLLFMWALTLLQPEPLKYHLLFPIFKSLDLHLGWFYMVIGVLTLVGTSNAVNLTDGLDGLAVGPIMVCCVVLAIFSYLSGHYVFAHYLQVPSIPGVGELAVLGAAAVGASLGFLWYNAPPAQVFMGDVGSLGLGGFIGGLGLALKQELLLPIVGGLFVLETVSVVIQVAYFKKTQRRIFAMAPIHHHFEKKGWPETTVVFRFWILALLFGIIALSTLKVR